MQASGGKWEIQTRLENLEFSREGYKERDREGGLRNSRKMGRNKMRNSDSETP